MYGELTPEDEVFFLDSSLKKYQGKIGGALSWKTSLTLYTLVVATTSFASFFYVITTPIQDTILYAAAAVITAVEINVSRSFISHLVKLISLYEDTKDTESLELSWHLWSDLRLWGFAVLIQLFNIFYVAGVFREKPCDHVEKRGIVEPPGNHGSWNFFVILPILFQLWLLFLQLYVAKTGNAFNSLLNVLSGPATGFNAGRPAGSKTFLLYSFFSVSHAALACVFLEYYIEMPCAGKEQPVLVSFFMWWTFIHLSLKTSIEALFQSVYYLLGNLAGAVVAGFLILYSRSYIVAQVFEQIYLLHAAVGVILLCEFLGGGLLFYQVLARTRDRQEQLYHLSGAT